MMLLMMTMGISITTIITIISIISIRPLRHRSADRVVERERTSGVSVVVHIPFR